VRSVQYRPRADRDLPRGYPEVQPAAPTSEGQRPSGQWLHEAVELDALPPTELRDRLRRAIDEVIDREAWNRAKTVEDAQRETCKRYAGVFREMVAREGYAE